MQEGADVTSPLSTLRGSVRNEMLPPRLGKALQEYDALRVAHGYEGAEEIARVSPGDLGRLMVGLRCLSFRSVCRIATRHSHVCPVYVRQHMSTLTTLVGLFWWNIGGCTVRERLLLLAWAKGRSTRSTERARP